MSPSGWHLGIYKTLAKHVVKKDKDAALTADIDSSLTQGQDVIYLIFDLMSIALTHTYLLE